MGAAGEMLVGSNIHGAVRVSVSHLLPMNWLVCIGRGWTVRGMGLTVRGECGRADRHRVCASHGSVEHLPHCRVRGRAVSVWLGSGRSCLVSCDVWAVGGPGW